MKTIFLLIVILFLSFHLSINQVFAQTNPTCPSIYGAACPSGFIFIEKKVQNPKNSEFVQALSSLDATFSPGSEVNFRIEVKNTGSSELTNISVLDRLPGNVKFISGPGSLNNSNVINWTIDKLAPNESKFFQIKLQVKPLDELKFDLACMTNFVQAQKDAQVAQNNSVFCIQARSLTPVAVTETPKTGFPAVVVWALSGLLLPAGLRLRKFAHASALQDETVAFIWETRQFLKRGGGDV